MGIEAIIPTAEENQGHNPVNAFLVFVGFGKLSVLFAN